MSCKPRTISLIVPTYRRPEELAMCLDHLLHLENVDGCDFQVLVIDNGSPEDSRQIVEVFRERMAVEYVLNEPGHGLGFSLTRGAAMATGDLIVELNDDALVASDFLRRTVAHFEALPELGILGFRAIETGYRDSGGGIGVINAETAEVEGNFCRPTAVAIEVEHVYGFCYAYRREVVERGAGHDQALLAKDYSSGNRIETDQCLTARELGFKVLYDGSMAVEHLAKPRGDMSERSARWRINAVRNTLYLYLKHYGLFGRKSLALRYAIVHDIGLRSALRQPTLQNWRYFAVGCRARCSAFAHYFLYLVFYRGCLPKTARNRQ